jgi:hypothetical protein
MLNVLTAVFVYVTFVFFAALGALQIVALHRGLEGLAWPIGIRHKSLGYLLAGLLLVMTLVGALLIGLRFEPLSPLAFLLMISVAIAAAVVVAIVGATLRLRWKGRRRRLSPRGGKRVDLGPTQAFFYQPMGNGSAPGLCLLPDPTAPDDDLHVLVQALVENGTAVLVLDWVSLGSSDRLTLQGLVAVGISHLARWPEIDATRVGLLGVGIGGDLALRSAAMDQGVSAVLAIEPVLSANRPWQGLDALMALSWFEARRRVHRWRHSALVKELDALTAISNIAPRPAAIVVGYCGMSEKMDGLEILRDEGGCFLVPTARTNAVARTTAWFKEHLV